MKNTKLRFDAYIAGAMHGRMGREVLEERSRAKLACKTAGLIYYDPAEDEKVEPNKLLDLKPNLKQMKWFVKKDDAHLDASKTLLVLTGDKSSSGTAWEMGRMFYKLRRPIVIVAPKMYHGHLTNFTTVKVSKIFETVEQAAKWIRKETRLCHT